MEFEHMRWKKPASGNHSVNEEAERSERHGSVWFGFSIDSTAIFGFYFRTVSFFVNEYLRSSMLRRF